MASLTVVDQEFYVVAGGEDSSSLPQSEEAVPRRRRHGSDTRRLTKLIGKRISPEDHALLTRYAASLGVDVSRLLEPLIDDLLGRARSNDPCL